MKAIDETGLHISLQELIKLILLNTIYSLMKHFIEENKFLIHKYN